MVANGGKALLCAAFLVALAGSAVAQTSVQCSAHAFLQIRSTGGGTCRASSSNHCSAFASSVSQFSEAFAEWFGDDYQRYICDEERVTAAARAVASACASVYTSAFTKVSCDYKAQGFACGWSQTDGGAWASATAEAVAQAVADAGVDDSKGFCLTDVSALSTVLVDAVSKSLSAGCATTGQLKKSYNSDLTQEFANAIADVFAKATAKVCEKGVYDGAVIATAKAECAGRATSDTTGGTQLLDCERGVLAKCCARRWRAASCRCPVGNGCESGNYSRQSDFGENAQRRIWKAPQSGEFCRCP